MTSFGNGKIEAYVGPVELGAADNLEQVIVDFIGGAKKTLDIAIQEVDSRTIAQAILDARWRGVRVDMGSAQVAEASQHQALPAEEGRCIRGLTETPSQALMVIDELIVVAGSYNYTEPANLYNDENIFVMGSTHEEVSGVEVEVSPTRKLGRFFKAEIERIIGLSEPYDPAA